MIYDFRIRYNEANLSAEDTSVWDSYVDRKLNEYQENLVFRSILGGENRFNERFIAYIYDNEKEEMLKFNFSYENNLKIAILFFEITKGTPFSTILSFKAAMRNVMAEEIELDTAFRNFTEENVINFAKKMYARGFTEYTVDNRLYLLGNLIKTTHDLAGKYLPDSKQVYDETYENVFAKVRKKYSLDIGDIGKKTAKVPFLTTKDIDTIINTVPAKNGAIVVLAYYGLREDSTLQEISTLKVGDIEGKSIHVRGTMSRTIKLSEQVIQYLRVLCYGVSKNSYLLRKDSMRNKNDIEKPLSHWTLFRRRLSHVNDAIGKQLTYSIIRRSGEVNYIAQKVSGGASHAEMMEAIDLCFRTFGIYSVDSLRLQEYASNSSVAKHRRQIEKLYRKYEEEFAN